MLLLSFKGGQVSSEGSVLGPDKNTNSGESETSKTPVKDKKVPKSKVLTYVVSFAQSNVFYNFCHNNYL